MITNNKKEKIIFYVFCGQITYGGSLMRCASIYDRFSKNKKYESFLFINKNLKDSLLQQKIIRKDKRIIEIPRFNYFPFKKINNLLSIIWLAFKIRKLKPSVIFSFQTLSLYSFLINIVNFNSFKVVAEVDSQLIWRTKNKLNYLFFLLCSITTDLVDCLSEDIFNSSKRLYKKSRLNILKSPKFRISPNSFNPISNSILSPVLPLKNRSIDLIFCGYLNEEKGAELLLNSLKYLYKIGIKPKTYFIGQGPINTKNKILFAIKNKEISSETKVFEDPNPQVFMSEAKFFCSLQHVDNYPSQSLIQAMQNGCILIATDVGSTRKLLCDEYSFLVNRDPKELSSTIEIALNLEPNELITFQKKSILKINSWANINNFIKYYQEIILERNT